MTNPRQHPAWCDLTVCTADQENYPGIRITPAFFWRGHHFSASAFVEPALPGEVHMEAKLWSTVAYDRRDTDTPPELMLIFTRTDGPKSVESYELPATQVAALQQLLATFRPTLDGGA